MQKIYRLIPIIVIISLIGLFSCQSPKKNIEKTPANNAFDVLFNYLKKDNYIASKSVPAMIPAGKLYNDLADNKNILILDLRKPKSFSSGYIKGSINIKYENLLNIFENKIQSDSFDKIVLVCYAGQKASFATSLLRLLGYDNVYALKWGISSWNKQFGSSIWMKKISDKHLQQIDTINYPIPNIKNKLPEIKSSIKDTIGYKILRERIQNIFSKPFSAYYVQADTVFKAAKNFFIISYWNNNRYNGGHIPTSIQYNPKTKPFVSIDLLATLPTDKPIVVYCNSGFTSGFVTAYLNVIGYNAKTLVYGAQSFMHSEMKKQPYFHAFDSTFIRDFPLQKGEKSSDKTIIKKKTIQVSGGC